MPIIAGISFEIIKFAGRNRSRGWVKAVMWPGLKLQLLTTREPDLDQLAVAIAALEAVLELETPGSMDARGVCRGGGRGVDTGRSRNPRSRPLESLPRGSARPHRLAA